MYCGKCPWSLYFPLLIASSWFTKSPFTKPKKPNKILPNLKPDKNPGRPNSGTFNPVTINRGTAHLYPLNFSTKMSL